MTHSEARTYSESTDFPLLGITVGPKVESYLPGLVFDTVGYVDFLDELGFVSGAASACAVEIEEMSPELRRAHDLGVVSGITRIRCGSYILGNEGVSAITMYAADIVAGAKAKNTSVNQMLNTVLMHETGHMYDRVLKGANVSKLKILNARLHKFGQTAVRLSRAMTQDNVIQDLLPLYSAYPLASAATAIGLSVGGTNLARMAYGLEKRRYSECPREAFARQFALDHAERSFVACDRD